MTIKIAKSFGRWATLGFVASSLLVAAPTVTSQTSLLPQAEQSQPERKQVGKIRSSTGLVNVQGLDGKNKFASAGTKLHVGDIINTQQKSTAVLEFIDTSQVALRPDSRFVVEDFEYQEENPIADKAEFRLLKGGVRALTGLISKRGDQDAFKMKGATATIGIRGTDFTLRLCNEGECGALKKKQKVSASEGNATTSGAAGRVAQVAGNVVAIDTKGVERQLERSAAIFPGEKLKASEDGFAVIVMADSGRMTLAGGSELEIAAFKYSPEAEQESVSSVKLVTGAVRFITGKIGKADPKNVSFVTATATIGIRGTSGAIGCFGFQCASFQADTASGMLLLFGPPGPGGQLPPPIPIPPGNSGFFGPGGLPQVVITQRSVIQRLGLPAPDPNLPGASFDQLSSFTAPPTGDGDKNDPQILVAVNDGEITVKNDGQPPEQGPLIVRRGQGVFIRAQVGAPPVLTQAPPRPLVEDESLSAPNFAPQQCAP